MKAYRLVAAFIACGLLCWAAGSVKDARGRLLEDQVEV